MTVLTDLTCVDCGFTARPISPSALAKGSKVRDPGEALCASCSSSRARLVRTLDTIPDTIDQIRALRMTRGAA